MKIIILEEFTETGKFLVSPEKGIYENQRFDYGVVENPNSDFNTIATDYFNTKADKKEIENTYDYYTLKLFHGDGKVNENYQEDKSYLNKEEISDNIDDLYAIISWKKKKNQWQLSWKNDKGVWADKEL